MIVPTGLSLVAVRAYTSKKALWLDRTGTETLTGLSTQWMAGVYISLSLFCFSRWALSYLSASYAFKAASVVSLLCLIVSTTGVFVTRLLY